MALGKIFYGWKIVGVSIVGLATGWAALGIFSFGQFIKPLENAFGWSRGEISNTLLVINLTGICMAPVLGILVDRFGVRRVLVPSSFMLGVLVASLYFLTSNIWHFYLVWFCVAVFGAAATPLSYSKVIVEWFDRRRGLALGLGLAGVGLGAALMPAISHGLITNYGWQVGYLGLGGIVLLVSSPVLYVFLRNTPQEMNLNSDGDLDSTLETDVIVGFTVAETVRRRPFWLMVSMFTLVGMSATAVIIHLTPLLIESGISRERAAAIQALMGLSLIFGRVFAGFLMDRIFAPYVSIAFLLGPVVGLALLATGVSGTTATAAAVLVGLAIGAEFDVLSYFVSRYFGLLSFGLIFGLLFAAFELGAGLGPALLGWCFDRTGEYTLALWAMCFAAAMACVLTALLGPYPDLPEGSE